MYAGILFVVFSLFLSGCSENHRFLHIDKNKYLVYVQPPMDALRANPMPDPTYCTKLIDVPYDPPLEPKWYHKITGTEPDKTFKGCGEREWEQKEGIWLASDVKYDPSIIEKTGPLIHGAAFLAGSFGAAAILGGHIESGLRGQATGNSGPNLYASTISGQPIPGLRFVQP